MSARIRLIPVKEDDCRDIWIWRNHPAARRNFFNNRKISWQEHKKWFHSLIKDSRPYIFIARKGSQKIGVIRFEDKRGKMTVSVNLNPKFIFRGFGAKIIRMGSRMILKKERTAKQIIAKIKKNNLPSQRVFSKAGYIQDKRSHPGYFLYVYNSVNG